jgi:hypothetical protein
LIGCLRRAIREQPVETDRIDHGSGKNMGADLGPFFHHHDAEIGVELLEADRRRKPGRPGADHHNVEFHRLAVGQIAHGSPQEHFRRRGTGAP